ncbi:MAG: cupin domain-containing protein [Candidatus Binatia bacterium]
MATIRRFRDGFRWEGVPVEDYADPAVRAVTKQVILGAREGATHYAVRYFEIAPGGKSSLDRHDHDHAVVVLRGAGRVLLGEARHEIGFGDAVYVGPRELHQFENTGDSPLGFLCVTAPARPHPAGK